MIDGGRPAAGAPLRSAAMGGDVTVNPKDSSVWYLTDVQAPLFFPPDLTQAGFILWQSTARRCFGFQHFSALAGM